MNSVTAVMDSWLERTLRLLTHRTMPTRLLEFGMSVCFLNQACREQQQRDAEDACHIEEQEMSGKVDEDTCGFEFGRKKKYSAKAI